MSCHLSFALSQYSPKGQVGEDGDGQEDGGDSTADVCDEGEDGGLHTTDHIVSAQVLGGKRINEGNLWENVYQTKKM